MCRFYGWGPDVVSGLDLDTVDEYLNCLEILEAREKLNSYKNQDWSHMTDQARSQMWNQTVDVAYPRDKSEEAKGLSNEELSNWIRGVLGG